MIFWISSLLIMGLYACLTRIYHNDKLFLIISCIHCGFIMSFRSIDIGTDTFNYAYAFNVIRGGGILPENHVASSSKMFLLLFKIFSFLPKTQGYMMITSIPVIISLYVLIKKYSENYCLSIITFISSYLFFYSMNAARHFLAISLIFMCFVLLENKKIAFSIVVFLIACAVHNAVSIFVLYYFIYAVKWSRKRFVAFIILAGIMMKAIPIFITIFIRIFPHYAWLSSRVFDRRYVSGGKTSLVYAFYSLLAVLLCFKGIIKGEQCSTIRINKILKIKHKNIQLTYRISCILALSMVMFTMYSYSILISRIAYVFFAFIILALPNGLNDIVNFRLCAAVVYIPLIIFMLLQLQGNYSGVLNYSFGF